jgi:hypothetical protein
MPAKRLNGFLRAGMLLFAVAILTKWLVHPIGSISPESLDRAVSFVLGISVGLIIGGLVVHRRSVT